MLPIQITVFTGYLGSGKTTTILSLLKQLPKDYKVVLLKNEFGDIEVDSKLAEQSSVTAVSEILNGCMCCILVGQMKNALLEIRDLHRPDRIIIESSGSALPATLALQLRDLSNEYPHDFKLDSIITVVDAINFTGYEDTSPSAKLQAKFCDVILLNKWELVSERQLDIVLDHLGTLNDLTPKLKCDGKNGVSSQLLFGLDTKLYLAGDEGEAQAVDVHNDEVETRTLRRGGHTGKHAHAHPHQHPHDEHESRESDARRTRASLTLEQLTSSLSILSAESIYRVKGFITLTDETSTASEYILNWAFGRFDLVQYNPIQERSLEGDLRLTIMGERVEVKKWATKLAALLDAEVS